MTNVLFIVYFHSFTVEDTVKDWLKHQGDIFSDENYKSLIDNIMNEVEENDDDTDPKKLHKSLDKTLQLMSKSKMVPIPRIG